MRVPDVFRFADPAAVVLLVLPTVAQHTGEGSFPLYPRRSLLLNEPFRPNISGFCALQNVVRKWCRGLSSAPVFFLHVPPHAFRTRPALPVLFRAALRTCDAHVQCGACSAPAPRVRCPHAPCALPVHGLCARLILCMPSDARDSFVPVRPRAPLRPRASFVPVRPCALARLLHRRLCAAPRLFRPGAPPCCSVRASSVHPCALARFLCTPPLRHPALPRPLHMFHARVPRVHAPSFPAAAFWLKTTVLHKENAPYICKAGKTSLLKMQNRRFQPPPMQKRKNQPKCRARSPNRRAGASA